ncbi:Rxt3-domain-containing protein [Aureobasidium pullulans]|uniref:Rxt3-domain-containing protein n=1 Tax=Aureobasidium pullulans TaxID=5580 RepID=A0A4V6TAK6_AURPU|nr:Rxt3-domain-containing protein [Aureobasidium pullulans]
MYKPAAVHGKIHSVDSQSQGLGLTCNACVKMDNRLPQPSSQPFAAAQSATSQVSSSSHPPYHTQTAQPPVQMPFSDPFHTRDPFMPSSTQHSRRDSYGIGPGGASAAPGMGAPYERAWSTQPQALLAHHRQQPQQHQQAQHQHLSQTPHPTSHPPSSTAASAATSAQMSSGPFPYDPARRRSVGTPLDPPPPPPHLAYSSRNMPPPSPTSGPPGSGFSMPAPRHTPSASPYVGSRELPGFSSRPGTTMSISSLIGGDPSSRHGNHSPKTVATAPSPPMKPIHPSSPQRARSASTRAPPGHYPRPHSPTSMMQAQRPAESKSQPFHQPGPHQPLHMSQHNAAPGFRPFQSSPPSGHPEEQHHYAGHAPSRPNSQPMHAHLDQELRNRQDMHDRPPPRHPSAFPPYVDHMGRPGPLSQPPSRADLERPDLNGHGHHQLPHTMSHTARSTPAPPPQSYGRLNFGPVREEYPGLFRPAVQMPSREEMEQRGPHNEMIGRPEHRQSPAMNGMDDRQRPNAAHYAMYGPPGYEAREGEEHPLQRAFLGVASEIRHKNGRSSPLPQAVQGAQPRHIGPGADPGVKSEFGRMFSGLGSGVGSNTPTAGIATPSRGSPARQVDVNEDTDSRKARSRLREDNREDSDSVDGRNTPTASQRGSKRPKTTHQPPHHHHHHAHAHHHHHHHHGMPEEQIPQAQAPFHPLRFPSNASTPQQAAAAAHHHHHHHHHAVHAHPPHHHHHNVRPPPMPSARKPQTSVSNQELLASISDFQRKHLGSQLYSTKLSLPPRESTPLDSKYHFKSSVKPIPRFEGKDNCTFTVRVPRAYLAASGTTDEGDTVAGGLEEICKTRAVWGSEVYSDDSDPVAAAVHSGWIRGDFGEFNEDLRELFSEQGEEASDTPELGKVVTEKPKVPLRLPPKADLHITLLILPALTNYMASTQNFLRSREWGSDHDGVSYMIHSIEFVEESTSNRFTERSAAAKHQRIKDDLARRREAAESLLGLLQGSRGNMTPASSNVSVGA